LTLFVRQFLPAPSAGLDLPVPKKTAIAWDVLASLATIVYIIDRYRNGGGAMGDSGIARIFKHGRSQAVRLPLAFRLPGDRVRVSRVERGILLEPIVTDLETWFRELDRFAGVPLMDDGRQQPPMPDVENVFD
jgi:antitoxin VapB